MGGIFLKIRTWWETADRTQRVVTIFGSAFLAVLLGGVFYFAGRPHMEMAYGGLTPAEQGRVVSEIQKMGVPVEFDLQGNVKVPHDKVALVRSQLAASGMAPTSGHLGNTDRTKIGPMMPRNVEEATLNAIREGEIAQALENISGVASARVLLNGGTKSGFMSEDEPASASVTITEQPGAELTGAPAKAMALLVSKAVPGLTTKNVTIVNQDGHTLYDGSEAEGFAAQSSSKLAAQAAEARRIKRELQPMLERFGSGNTVVTVRVEMDFDKRSERAVLIRPKTDPIEENSTWETMTGNGKIAKPNVPSGVSANTGAPVTDPGRADGRNPGYGAVQDGKRFPYDTITKDTESAPGSITNASISILVNEKADPPIDTAAVEEAVKGWVGAAKLASNAWSVKVTAAPFDASPEKAAQKVAADTASRDRMQQIFSLLPIGALIVVAFVVLKSIRKVATSSNVVMHALPGGQMVAVPAGPTALGTGALALGAGEDDWEEVEEYDPIAEAPRKKKRKKKRIEEEEEDDEEERVRVGKISEKVNVPLEQIKKMATAKPEAIAMLLKSWLVEDRR